MPNNKFTVKVLDVIAPKIKKSEYSSENEPQIESASGCIFIVMEFMDTDLRRFLSKNRELEVSPKHINMIIYNLLCAMRFLHS